MGQGCDKYGWETKNKKDSSFFPDSWDDEKVRSELAFAYTNKTHKEGNLWKGKMTDGVEVNIHIENEIINSAYPSFPKNNN